jgi:hypothetical protein
LLSKRIAAQIHPVVAVVALRALCHRDKAEMALPTETVAVADGLIQQWQTAAAVMAPSPAVAVAVALHLQTGSTLALAAMAAAALCVCGAGDDDGIRNP